MKRLTKRDEDTGQVYAMSDKQSILDKLCLYEEAEERGFLVSVSGEEPHRLYALCFRVEE